MLLFLTRIVLFSSFFTVNIRWKLYGIQCTHAEEVIFENKILENEYIVQYRHYYFSAARRKYLNAAFRRANVHTYIRL